MKYDEFVKLGKEAGFTGKEGEDVAVKIGRLAKLVEQATLERAAKEVEKLDACYYYEPVEALEHVAKGIRALKDFND